MLAIVIVGAIATPSKHAAIAQSAKSAPAEAQSPLAALSLDTLITEADIVFVGQVLETTQTRNPEKGVPTRVTSFLVKEGLKGVHKGETISVRQFAHHSAATSDGEIVLWYLKAKDRVDNSFSSPVGRYSGDFRRAEVVPPSTISSFMVQNQMVNRALWSNQDDGHLWDKKTFKRESAGKFLDVYLSELKESDQKEFDRRKEEILRIGDGPCKPVPLPIELVLAATYARLSSH